MHKIAHKQIVRLRSNPQLGAFVQESLMTADHQAAKALPNDADLVRKLIPIINSVIVDLRGLELFHVEQLAAAIIDQLLTHAGCASYAELFNESKQSCAVLA